MSGLIRKEHNASTLMYHIVCPAKYRSAVISDEVDKKLREVCLGIEARYEITFLEIGTEQGHVHFLVQSVPTYSPEQIVRTIKSITARKIFESCTEVKKCCEEDNFGLEGIM
jgi:REP element-mobilizing transposase RayT